MKRRAERGEFTGRRPYGYNQVDGALVKAKTEAQIVRRIFAEFVAGRSMVAIARGLHGDGVPTAEEGATWRQPTVSGILKNPLYTGKLRYGGELLDGQHDAILDDETRERASALLAARGPGKGRGRPSKGRHLFQRRGGVQLRCGECGDAMVPITRVKRKQAYYGCNGHIQLGDDYCKQGYVQRADVDEAVYDYFAKVGLDVEATREALREARDHRLAEVRALLAEAEREAQRARETFDRIRANYKRGDMPRKEWHEEWQPELTEEREAAEQAVERLRAQAQDVEGWTELEDAEQKTLERLAAIRRAVAGDITSAQDLDAVRAALARLFKEFVLHREQAKIEPKLRGAIFAFDLTDMENPKTQRLTPSKVPLALAGNKQVASGCL